MSRRTPSHPEIVTGAMRSITPDEQPAAISGPGVVGPPAWFVAIKNLETKVDDHERRDNDRHDAIMNELKSLSVETKALKSRNGILAALGGGAGGGIGYGIVEALKAMFGG